jgi:hypothetical protein
VAKFSVNNKAEPLSLPRQARLAAIKSAAKEFSFKPTKGPRGSRGPFCFVQQYQSNAAHHLIVSSYSLAPLPLVG